MGADSRPSLAQLPRGHRFSPVSFRLSAGDARRYLEAVQDGNSAYFDDEGDLAWTPPMAAAAFTLKAVMDQARLPSGSLHAAQELEFRRPIPIDSQLAASAAVAQRSEMRGMAISVVEFEVSLSGTDEVAVIGRSTVMAPLEEESVG